MKISGRRSPLGRPILRQFPPARQKRGWDETPRLRWKDWSPLVQQECLAARDAAVLIDQSMYSKIQVQGPDAVRALNRVYGAEMDVPAGTSVYTGMGHPPIFSWRTRVRVDVAHGNSALPSRAMPTVVRCLSTGRALRKSSNLTRSSAAVAAASTAVFMTSQMPRVQVPSNKANALSGRR